MKTRLLQLRELQLVLTARDKQKQQPMCGVPYHSAGSYIQRLAAARAIEWRCASRWKTQDRQDYCPGVR